MSINKALVFMLGTAISGISVFAANLNSSDSMFFRKAAEGGMAEVKLGQLARDKAADQQVKDFGSRMVKDHGKANDQLKDLASKKDVTLPDSLSAKDQALYDRLSKMSGAAFDKEYMRAMIRDHEQDVAEFRKESEMAKDSDAKDFAAKTLPTLEDHLQQAKEIGSKMGLVSTGTRTRGTTARKDQ